VNTIDSRKTKGERFFELELYGIHPCATKKSPSMLLGVSVIRLNRPMIPGRMRVIISLNAHFLVELLDLVNLGISEGGRF